jgi:hypothetical protein
MHNQISCLCRHARRHRKSGAMLELWLPLDATASRDCRGTGSPRAPARQRTRKRLSGPAASTAKAPALLRERSEEGKGGSKAIGATGRTEYWAERVERATSCPGRSLDRRADARYGSAACRRRTGGGGASTAGWQGIKRSGIPTGVARGLACHRIGGSRQSGTHTRSRQNSLRDAPFPTGTIRPHRACCPCNRLHDRGTRNPGAGT